MGMKNCRSCKELVDTSAKSCPRCGAREPTRSIKQVLIATGIAIALAYLISWSYLYLAPEMGWPH